MTSTSSPQHEPTMEEILASIRKIISDDQPDAAKSAPQPVPVRAAPVQPAPQAEIDILELTEEVPDEDEAIAEPIAQVDEPIENDIAFENIEPEPEPEPAMDNDELISDSTRSAMGRAFAKLHGIRPRSRQLSLAARWKPCSCGPCRMPSRPPCRNGWKVIRTRSWTI